MAPRWISRSWELIELDIAGSYIGGLNGTQIEISPDRHLRVGADNNVNNQLKLGVSSVTDSGLRMAVK